MVSRRTFLGIASSTAVIPALSTYGQDALALLPTPRTTPSSAHVVEVNSDYVVVGATVHKILLGEMIEAALKTLTKEKSLKASWHALLHERDVIGLKFNSSAQQAIGTSAAMAEVLIESLLDAGWPLDQLVCIEAPTSTVKGYQTRPMAAGYRSVASNFGSGTDNLSRVLDQVTAIINVPFLKTHNIASITCCLKNLSHGLVQHPARFHKNGCSPYVADIVALPEIKDKLKLNIVDALRVVYRGGPSASDGSIADLGSIVASTDPVALDAVGVSILNDTRSRKGLGAMAAIPAQIPYLAHAQALGLGIAKLFDIDFDRLRLG